MKFSLSLSSILFPVAVVFLFVLEWFPAISLARDWKQVINTREIRFCIAPITPSFALPTRSPCRENCQFTGPGIREIEAVVRALGKDLRIVTHCIDWDEQFHDTTGRTDLEAVYTPRLMESGMCDIYPIHMTKNSWRVKKLDFAVLFPSRMMVIVHKSRAGGFSQLADLAGKTAAVERNTSYHTWLLEQNHGIFAASPVQFQFRSVPDSLKAVEQHEADFTLVDVDIALWNTTHRRTDLSVVFPVGPIDEIGWAFRKQDRDLRNAVEEIFHKQAQDETSDLNRIWKEEFGVTLLQMKALIHATEP
jgi:ABC-type amino acid transport substrate-binding protein